MWRKRVALTVAALTVTATVACSGGDDATPPAGAQQLTMTMGGSLAFEPTMLTVKAGTPVVVTMRNVGTTDHDFSIMGMPAANTKSVIQSQAHGHAGHQSEGAISRPPKLKSDVRIWFTPTTPGTYTYDCTPPGHNEQGMTSTIVVT